MINSVLMYGYPPYMQNDIGLPTQIILMYDRWIRFRFFVCAYDIGLPNQIDKVPKKEHGQKVFKHLWHWNPFAKVSII